MRIFSKLLPASKMKLVISSIGVLTLVAFSVAVVYAATQSEVTLVKDGEKTTYQTHANTVGDLLEEINVTISEHDTLSHPMEAPIEQGMEIEWNIAKQLYVTIDEKTKDYYTVAETVGQFLKENQLEISNHDDVSFKEDDVITDGLELVINQAFQVTIKDGIKTEQVWATGGSVQDLLKSEKIKLGELDKIEPDLKADLTNDMVVGITRVEVASDTVEETIEYATETREDNTLEKGKRRVISEGKNGKRIKEYEVILENGEEVSRELVNETVIEESITRVVAMGTKEPTPNLTTLSSGSEPSGGRELYVTATAYTANCNGCSGITRTGINLRANPNMKVISVDPNVIPLGTKVWVEGYGTAVAADTGSSIVGNKIDVHVPTKADANKWGRKQVRIKILD